MYYKEWLQNSPRFINHIDVVISGDHAALAVETDFGAVTTLHTDNEFGLGKPENQIHLGLSIAKQLGVPIEIKDVSSETGSSDEIDLFNC